MIYLMVEYGILLKSLPLIEIDSTCKILTYVLQRGGRIGRENRRINISGDIVFQRLLKGNKRDTRSPYLFQSIYSRKSSKPISIDYCQSKIQAYTGKLLGFRVSAQVIYRDCLKYKARDTSLLEFIDKVIDCPLAKQTKLYYWLNGKLA